MQAISYVIGNTRAVNTMPMSIGAFSIFASGRISVDLSVRRYRVFNKALVDWLRTSADLVTFTGYNASTNLSIMMATREDNLKTPSCNVFHVTSFPLLPSVDKGVNDSLIRCVLRHSSEVTVLEMVAAIEDLAQQDITDDSKADASFTGTGIATTSIRYIGTEGSDHLGSSIERVSKGVIEARVMLRILWRET